MAVEKWKPIAHRGTYATYEVSNLGRVQRVSRRVLTPIRNGKRRDYLRVHIGTRIIFVHRLVAEAFIGPCPDGYQINHKDGNPSNNSVENLEYVTAKENQQHSWRELNRQPHAKGEAVHFAKLTDTDVIKIRLMRAEGMTYRAIAAHFNTKPANVWHICINRTWKHLL